MMRSVPDCAVLYPCDAVSTERLVAEMAQHKGLAYMRTSRPKTPVTYGPDEAFPIGGSKMLRQSGEDVATVVGVGVTVFEALKAYDQLFAEGIHIRVIDAYSLQPIDAATLMAAGEATDGANHYRRGSLRRRAAWATRSARPWHRPASRFAGSPCARFRAAASPRNCSIVTASPQSTSSRL